MRECALSDLEEARTRDHDACNEREYARKEHDIDDEVGHGQAPHTQAPSCAAGLGRSCILAKRRRPLSKFWAALRSQGLLETSLLLSPGSNVPGPPSAFK